MNKFHCTEDEEHVNKTSIVDVANIIKFSTNFDKHIDPELIKKAEVLIDNNAGPAECHQWTHEWIDWQINQLHNGKTKGIIACYVLDTACYPIYLDMIKQTNVCGRNKYSPISEEKFNIAFKEDEGGVS